MNQEMNGDKEKNYLSENSISGFNSSCHDSINHKEEKVGDDFDNKQENEKELLMNTTLDGFTFDDYFFDFNEEIQYDHITCVELMNNNRIYINYESDWTLRNVRINI